MIYEYLDKRTIVATSDERDYFYRTNLPPPNWYVFYSHYSGTKWKEMVNHRAALIHWPELLKRDLSGRVTNPLNVQSTVFVIENMLLNVVSGPIGSALAYATHFGLTILWPHDNLPILLKPVSLGDRAVDIIVSYFGVRGLSIRSVSPFFAPACPWLLTILSLSYVKCIIGTKKELALRNKPCTNSVRGARRPQLRRTPPVREGPER